MINKVILMGRLGKDPVIRKLESGRIVANMTLATNEYFMKDGERQELTEWHNIELWDKQAELAEKHLRKGRIIYVEGKIKTEKFVSPNGEEKQLKKIRVQTVQLMDLQSKSNRQDEHNDTSY